MYLRPSGRYLEQSGGRGVNKLIWSRGGVLRAIGRRVLFEVLRAVGSREIPKAIRSRGAMDLEQSGAEGELKPTYGNREQGGT